ncbi:MAG TPA: glycosyl transferase [Staphylococcus sp.]|nr:glycosyl transferase [Staphylococcus sp.]
MQNGLVSVIMPLYNNEDYIERSILSVINQTYENWEILIINDKSVDSSKEIATKYSDIYSNIKLINLKINNGVANARNIGINNARGEYLAFLDSDDEWLPEKLEKQISFMNKNDYNFTCTYYGKIDSESSVLPTVIKPKYSLNYNQILKNNIGNSTAIINVKKLGKFTVPLIKKRNDYALWLKVIKKAKKVHTLEEVLSYHRLHSNTLSSKKLDLIKYHYLVYRDYEKLSIVKTISLIIYWSVKTIYNMIRSKIL